MTIKAFELWVAYGGDINAVDPLVIAKIIICPDKESESILKKIIQLGYDFDIINKRFENSKTKEREHMSNKLAELNISIETMFFATLELNSS